MHPTLPSTGPADIGPQGSIRAPTKVGDVRARLACAGMDHPTPAETQPPLTWRSQAWRLAVCALISALVWAQASAVELESTTGCSSGCEVLFGVAAYVLVVFRRRAPVTIADGRWRLPEHVLGHRCGPGDASGRVVATQRGAAGRWSASG